MMKLLLLLSSAIVLAVSLTGSGAVAAPQETCDGPISGLHGSVTVTGTCAVAGPLTIHGNLTLGHGTVFVGFGPAVQITGNVKVGKGALLAIGYNAAPGVLGPDTVGGNVVANQPLSIYLGNMTVHGNVVSNGGGTVHRFYNFPIKDNKIGGNVVIHGWTGGWWGVIANTIHGNVDVSRNTSVVHPADDPACEASGTFPTGCDPAPGKDDDSSEVQSRGTANPQHISGNLICHGNTPPAQINPADGGAANIVDGHKIGECAGL